MVMSTHVPSPAQSRVPAPHMPVPVDVVLVVLVVLLLVDVVLVAPPPPCVLVVDVVLPPLPPAGENGDPNPPAMGSPPAAATVSPPSHKPSFMSTSAFTSRCSRAVRRSFYTQRRAPGESPVSG